MHFWPIKALILMAQLLSVACIQEGIEIKGGGSPPPILERQAISPKSRTPAATAPNAPNAPNDSSIAKASDNLAEWYSIRSNYALVINDVRSFYAPVRYNGCVAFISAALRRVGVDIPIATEQEESPSLVTRPFANYLEQKLNWVRIGEASQLRAGDIVFTRDNPSYPGYPAHTYMFQSWSRKNLGIALVIDNQDFTHERNIYDNDTAFNFTPYAFALRSP